MTTRRFHALRVSVAAAGLLALVGSVSGPAEGQEGSIRLLRASANAVIEVEQAGFSCRPGGGELRVLLQPAAPPGTPPAELRVWLEGDGPFTCEATAGKGKAAPRDLKKGFVRVTPSALDQYALVPEPRWFQVDAPSGDAPQAGYVIRLKRPTDVWPALAGGDQGARKAVEAWAERLALDLSRATVEWRSLGGKVRDGREVFPPSGRRDGQFVVTIGGHDLRFPVRKASGAAAAGPASGGWLPRFDLYVVLGVLLVVSGLVVVGFVLWRLLRQGGADPGPAALPPPPPWAAGLEEGARELRRERAERERAVRHLAAELENVRRSLVALEASARRSGPPGGPVGGDPGGSRHASPVAPAATTATVPTPPSRATTLEDVRRVADEVLARIDPEGRRASLASLQHLMDWLATTHAGVTAHPVGEMTSGHWGIVVLTADNLTGIAIPALDFTIGPGEVTRWFDGRRYDGTQVLTRANVSGFAQARFDAAAARWVPTGRGTIELT